MRPTPFRLVGWTVLSPFLTSADHGSMISVVSPKRSSTREVHSRISAAVFDVTSFTPIADRFSHTASPVQRSHGTHGTDVELLRQTAVVAFAAGGRLRSLMRHVCSVGNPFGCTATCTAKVRYVEDVQRSSERHFRRCPELKCSAAAPKLVRLILLVCTQGFSSLLSTEGRSTLQDTSQCRSSDMNRSVPSSQTTLFL